MTEDRASNPFPGVTPYHDHGAPEPTQTMALDPATASDPTRTMALDPVTAPDPTQTLAPDTTQAIDLAQDMAPGTAEFTTQVAAHGDFTEEARPWFRRKRFAFPSAVLLVFLVIMLSTGGNDPAIFDRTRSAAELRADLANGVPSGAIGQNVRDGTFAFTVTSVESPRKTITNRAGGVQTAQGMFVIIRLNVTNIGYDPRSLTATDQFLISDKGQRFATSATISSLAGAETIFLKRVNPGHTVNGAPMLFDVPPGTTIASIELHDSMSSTGVKVRLF